MAQKIPKKRPGRTRPDATAPAPSYEALLREVPPLTPSQHYRTGLQSLELEIALQQARATLINPTATPGQQTAAETMIRVLYAAAFNPRFNLETQWKRLAQMNLVSAVCQGAQSVDAEARLDSDRRPEKQWSAIQRNRDEILALRFGDEMAMSSFAGSHPELMQMMRPLSAPTLEQNDSLRAMSAAFHRAVAAWLRRSKGGRLPKGSRSLWAELAALSTTVGVPGTARELQDGWRIFEAKHVPKP